MFKRKCFVLSLALGVLLAQFCNGLRVRVNLIPLSPTSHDSAMP